MKELFKPFGEKAKTVIKAINQGTNIHWEQKCIEGRTVLIAYANESGDKK